MNFSFSGTPEVAAPVQRIWVRLLDPYAVAHAGPGVERVEVVDAGHFRVITVLKLGGFKLSFTMNVELFDMIPERELRMRARGKATGSSIEVMSRIRLEPMSEARTRLHWNATTDIGGIVARVGGQRLEGLARELTQRFWDRFIAGVESGT
ncbi:MAG: SRPBCC domain-containing protein [Gemmatimonadota bacterium]